MKRPLVPVDGSADALRALSHATSELRGSAEAQLHLLNVQPAAIHVWPGRLASPDLIEAELRRQGEEVLQAAEAAALASGIRCVRHVRIGPAADEIAACA